MLFVHRGGIGGACHAHTHANVQLQRVVAGLHQLQRLVAGQFQLLCPVLVVVGLLQWVKAGQFELVVVGQLQLLVALAGLLQRVVEGQL